jgi:hypothetical protein
MGALMKWLNSQPGQESPAQRPRHSIDELRRRCLELLTDCTRPNDERIRGQLVRASTAQQLWQVRCDIYQAIAHQHCEAEAARRLNELLPAFEGWLPPGALRPL